MNTNKLYELEIEAHQKLDRINKERQIANDAFSEGMEKGFDIMFQAMREALKNEDADDNKLYARWNKDPTTGFTNCSNCNCPPPGDAELKEFYESDYCPCCGARMQRSATE